MLKELDRLDGIKLSEAIAEIKKATSKTVNPPNAP